MNRKRENTLLVRTVMVLALLTATAVETAQAQFDFGDAPDGEPTGYPLLPMFNPIGRFPTHLSSNGARTLDITRITLGSTADLEADARTVNADLDDGVVGMTIVLTSIPPSAWLEVGVSAGTGGAFWLNVLIDLNMDGEWPGHGMGGEDERVVRNFPVRLAAGASQVVVPPPFAFGNGNRLPDGAWMRLALTDSPVDDAWDGSGQFAAGEIEDYVVRMPTKPDGRRHQTVTVVWRPPSPIKVNPPQRVNLMAVVTVAPGPPPPVTVFYTLTRRSGGVAIIPPPPIAGQFMMLVPLNILNFVANVPKGAELPSRWEYRFWTEDPLTYVTATDVVIGFGDAEGIIEFVPDDGTIYIDDDWAVPPPEAVLKPGFLWKVHQVDTAQPNTIARAEAQLAGELGENLADPAAIGVALGEGMEPELPGGPITFEIDSVINLNQYGELSEGSFPNDGQMPGIPGLTGSDDNIAAEILTWLDLPEGQITMGVNSDDGFRLDIGGAGFGDRFAIKVGEFDGGRAASDSIFRFVVRKAGLYPARLVWEEGLWGATLEWFTVREDGARVLVNDRTHGGIAAYRATSGAPRAIATKIVPEPYTQSAPPDTAIEVHLREGDFPIHSESIRLEIDGEPVEAEVLKTGDVIEVRFQPSDPFASDSTHRVALSFIDRVAVVRNWEFTVVGGLLGHWLFDEGSGIVAYDSSGYGNHGWLMVLAPPDPSWVEVGPVESGPAAHALEFHGNGCVDLGKASLLDFGTGDWSVSAWIKTTQRGTTDEDKGTIFAKGGDWSGGIRYALVIGEVGDGVVTLTTDDDVTKVQATGTTTVNDDRWHHIAGVRDGNALRLYVDGEPDGSAGLPAGYDLSGTSQHNAYIGAVTDHRDGSLAKYFRGLIDDVQIYNRALHHTKAFAQAE